MDRIAVNREAWNSRVAPHLESDFYDLPGFRAGKCSLHALELELLGPVEGKSLLHLQCHFGQDTLSLARRGAHVTGVDFSDKALEAARQFREELNLQAEFVESDVLQLELGKRFDVVFTSYGVLGWLPDLAVWAKVVNRHLAPGGHLCLVEFHPALLIFDFDSGQLDYDYFCQSYSETTSGTYAKPDDPSERCEHFWSHSLSEVLTPLLAQGLILKEFREVDCSPYGCFPGMVERAPREWVYPPARKFPHLFALSMSKVEETQATSL